MRRRDRLYAWVRRHPLVSDAALASGLFLTLALLGPSDPAWLRMLLGAVMCGALVFRRVRPVASFAVVAACGLVQWAAGMSLSQLDFVLLFALFAVAAYGPRWASRAGLGVGVLGAVLAGQRYALPEGGAEGFVLAAIGLTAVVVATWAMGDVRRVRQAYVDELVGRAQQAERERDQQARIAVADERARIAREMHDVVAHNLSVIVVQADGGRYVADNDPRAAAEALETIAHTGRGALTEMRRLLGVLRHEDDTGELGPQPGLALIPELIGTVRAAGLPVGLDVRGRPRPLEAGPSLAAYRVVQEALTNAIKHAGPIAKAEVGLVYEPAQLRIVVDDDGRGAAAQTDGAGHGLVGMRERVAAYGGTVTAGPRAGGGWRVEVAMAYGDGNGNGNSNGSVTP